MDLKKGNAMWYKSINNTQFRSYVRQDARINSAYWLSAKALKISEEQENTAHLEQVIASMNARVANLLNAVNDEVVTQTGLTKDLIQHQLKHTESYCIYVLKNIKYHSKFAGARLKTPNENQLIAQEIAFIKERADMISDDDLLEEYDRAIYLIYQALNLLDNGIESEKIKADCRQRIEAACDLMSPGFLKIQKHCNEYIGHLQFSNDKNIALINQQIVDYSSMFTAGLSLARLNQIIFKFSEDQQTETWTKYKLTRFQNYITRRASSIQSRLITSNLERAHNIGFILDPILFNCDGICEHAL